MSILQPLLNRGASAGYLGRVRPFLGKGVASPPIRCPEVTPSSRVFSTSFFSATARGAGMNRMTLCTPPLCRLAAFPASVRVTCGIQPIVRARANPQTLRLHTLSVSGATSGFRGTKPGLVLSPGPFGTVRTASLVDPILLRTRHALSLHLGSVSHLTSWQNTPPGKPPRNRITAGIGAVGTGLVLLAGKGKYLLGALKLTKFASLGSMLLTVGTYSMFFGLPYAAGMVGLILVHESGHALVMRHYGVPFSPMVFVPFMGASVMMKRAPRDAFQEAMIAFGGPVMGSMGAAGVAVAGAASDSQLLYALADFGYMINLFNLLPIGMMDGGRICGALSPYIGVAGLGLGGFLAYEGVVSNPIFYLILLAGGYETFMKFYRPDSVPLNYYRITTAQRVGIAGGYFGLIASIMAGMAMNARSKKSPEQLQREKELTIYAFD